MIEIVHLKKGHRTVTSVFGLDMTEFFTIKNYKARYAAGLEKPHYWLPAIPLEVVYYSDDYMYDTVYIHDGDCIYALWDFNWDRCMDFGTPYGEYQGGLT